MEKLQYCMTTPIGRLYVVASEKGLGGVFFNKQPGKVANVLGTAVPDKFIRQAVDQIEEYFIGKRKKFDLSLNLQGTPFQQRVWKELSKIPFGRTVSYRDIAQRIQNPKAVRAVGSANGKNPFCIVVPCHRVIAADGGIGGYSGGLSIKQRLLMHEQAQ